MNYFPELQDASCIKLLAGPFPVGPDAYELLEIN